jgi:alkylated DNA repair dioxygenase AlkB
LEHGSLLVMSGSTQHHYFHGIAKTTKPIGDRINLTYRQLILPD